MCGPDGEVTLEDLPCHLCGNRPQSNGQRQSLEEFEREYIAKILGYTGGKKSRAAAILGSRKTLLEKSKRYGLG